MFDLLTHGTSLLSSSPEETRSISQKIARSLVPGTVVCLDGALGAGKTTFAKGIIQTLAEVEADSIQSPTFILLNIYPTSTVSLCHFDLYRINHPEEFQARGFMDHLDSSDICLIEWPCKIASVLPKDALYIHIEHVSNTQRLITFSTWEKRCQ